MFTLTWLRRIVVLFSLLWICGFLPYTTFVISIGKVEDGAVALNDVTRVVKDFGYVDAEVSYPKPAKFGFRSTEPKGIFVIAQFDAKKKEIEISYSEVSSRLSEPAAKQLAQLVEKLKVNFGSNAVRLSGPE